MECGYELDQGGHPQERGWNAKKRTFVVHYGSSDLDAANLMQPLTGFLSLQDGRMKSTIEAIERELSSGAPVYRRRASDGQKGGGGALLPCGFWLVACLARLGEAEKAMANFRELLESATQLGLLPKEIDPTTGHALGNFQQAFSHMGLTLAASGLAEAMDARTVTPG